MSLHTYIHTLLDHSLNGAFQGQWKQNNANEHNMEEYQLAGGRPVGYLQTWLRS